MVVLSEIQYKGISAPSLRILMVDEMRLVDDWDRCSVSFHALTLLTEWEKGRCCLQSRAACQSPTLPHSSMWGLLLAGTGFVPRPQSQMFGCQAFSVADRWPGRTLFPDLPLLVFWHVCLAVSVIVMYFVNNDEADVCYGSANIAENDSSCFTGVKLSTVVTLHTEW